MLVKPLTIGIGSLPLIEVSSAIEYCSQHDIPFLPHLIELDGDMIEQVKNLRYSCLEEFKKKIDINKVIKVQVVGPESSNLSLQVIKNAIDFLFKELQSYRIIIFIDEPILSSVESLSQLIAYCKSRFIKTGLHCCNKDIDPKLINMLDIDILSYDYFLNPNLHTKVSKSIELALGVVETGETQSTCPILHEANYISATCGLAYSKKSPQLVLKLLRDASKKHS